MVDPEKLRMIADWLDSVDTIMRNIWSTSADPRKEDVLAFIESRQMQTDLREWADELEDL